MEGGRRRWKGPAAATLLVILVAAGFLPIDEEPGIRWGYSTGISTVPGMVTYVVAPRSACGRLVHRWFGRFRWATMDVHRGTPGGSLYPREGVRGRLEGAESPHMPLREIWMDAEAERRVRTGEFR